MMKETLKRLMEVFLSLFFLISMAFGVCGTILEPDGALHYSVMFAPALMALTCTLPSLLTIHADRLTTGQLAARIVLQLLLEEGIVLTMMHFGFHSFSSIWAMLTVAFSVLLVYAGAYLIDWIHGCMEAEELNRRLTSMQKGTEST